MAFLEQKLIYTIMQYTMEDHSIGRVLSEKKYRGTELLSEKTEAWHAELNKRAEAATSSYSAAVGFLQYIYSVLVAKNH